MDADVCGAHRLVVDPAWGDHHVVADPDRDVAGGADDQAGAAQLSASLSNPSTLIGEHEVDSGPRAHGCNTNFEPRPAAMSSRLATNSSRGRTSVTRECPSTFLDASNSTAVRT